MEFEEQPIILFKGGFKILKSYKTEIDPTEEQTKKIKKTIGTCRFIYNFYLAKNKEISSPRKIGIGMFLAAIAYTLMVLVSLIGKGGAPLDSPAAIEATGGSVSSYLVSPYWLITTYFTLTIAELFLSPMGLSFVAKVAPPQLKGLMQGGWLMATALGNYLSGVIAIPYKHFPLWSTFTILVVTSLISGIFIFSVMKRLEQATKS